ncbi:(R)-mandelonitrile beta-glucosyltransferase-like [Actinidia eriantha]|uniref:(R)-mandelonitrile beta-glucosyltransferase-like n=1 Tax=Actinidia eriantha TaxID=165200 RepID=UPI00258F8808|nr:(R)-mandelonitrile beta-glucosyltransferase-like [Actinidia eriantha]
MIIYRLMSPLTCIIADGVMSFTTKASEELGIPNVLKERGITPFKDTSDFTNAYLETVVDMMLNSVIEQVEGACKHQLSFCTFDALEHDVLMPSHR